MKYLIFAALAASASVAVAQETANLPETAPAPAAMPAQPAAPVADAAASVSAPHLLPVNTQIQVTPVAEISSKHLEVGQRVMFNVVADVTENQTVVIPRGATVEGEITFKTGRAIGGKSGKFDVTFRSITLNGQTYALSGVHRQEGRGNTVGALLGSILISGRSAVMLPGQIVTAMTAAPISY